MWDHLKLIRQSHHSPPYTYLSANLDSIQNAFKHLGQLTIKVFWNLTMNTYTSFGMTTSCWIELLAYGQKLQVVAKTLIGLEVVPSLWIPNHSPSQDLRFDYFSSLIQHSSKLLISHFQQPYSPSSKGNRIPIHPKNGSLWF
jgi:hypothetical protein